MNSLKSACISLLILSAMPVLAEAAHVSYSGRLWDGVGSQQSMVVSLAVWLCESPTGLVSECVWTEVHEDVHVTDGFFSIDMGSITPLPKPLPSSLWITVAVGSDPPLQPWQEVGAVPFALRAEEVGQESGESLLRALKVRLGFSDNPSDPNYITDDRFARNLGNAISGDCPPDYVRDYTGTNAQYVVCKKGLDEMVKVGDFWIDRYEMSLWETPDCGGTQYGLLEGDAHTAGFVRNGSDITKPLYGCSLHGVAPSRWLTWFQSQRACTASGKRLCTDSEWQAAAFGTPDPHTADPADDSEPCNIWPNSKPANSTWAKTNDITLCGSAPLCVSATGPYDMVGNLFEWTSDWWGQGPDEADGSQPNDGDFKGDGYWNVDVAAYCGADTTYPDGLPVFPASGLRGGSRAYKSRSGVFSLYLGYGPSAQSVDVGARCCRR